MFGLKKLLSKQNNSENKGIRPGSVRRAFNAAAIAATLTLLSCGGRTRPLDLPEDGGIIETQRDAQVDTISNDADQRDTRSPRDSDVRDSDNFDADIRDSRPDSETDLETDVQVQFTECPSYPDGEGRPPILFEYLRTEPFIGEDDAQFIIIWLVDAEGHYDRRFYNNEDSDGRSTFELLVENHVNTHEARIALHHFPHHFHDDAEYLARVIACATPREFEMLERILRIPRDPEAILDPYHINRHISEMGIGAGFNGCLVDPDTWDMISAQVSDGMRAGAIGVPWFAILNSSTGQCLSIPGAYGYNTFQEAINQLR